MTKRFISVCLVMTAIVASTNAFASRARQQVMGTADPFGALSDGTHGSLYVDDNYNIFYNPAYVNDFKNWVAIEKNNGIAGSTTGEGGFVYGMNNFAIGLYMNRGDAVNATAVNNPAGASRLALTETRIGTTNTTVTYSGRANNARPIDLIMGYDAGMAKLGLGVTYGYNKTAAAAANIGPAGSDISENSLSDINVRIGAQVADLDPFFSYKVKGTDKTTAFAATNTVTENTSKSWTLGTRYHFGEWVPFAYYRRDNLKSAVSGATTSTTELRAVYYGLGFGRNTKLAEGTTFNYALSYHRASAAGARQSVIPVEFSLEHDLTSWLVARGGLQFRVMDQTNGQSVADATRGRLGMTVKAGKANIDWTIGGGSAAGATYGNADSASFDFSNGLFTTASLTYAW